NAELHAGRQLLFDSRKRLPYILNHFERVCGGQDPNAHEGCGFTVEAHVLVVVFSAELNIGDFAQAHHDTVVLLHDHLAEVVRVTEVSVGNEVNGNHGTLGRTKGRKI